MASSKPTTSLVIQDRDIAFLRGLFESRVMTAEHIATLFFDGYAEYTKKRLQKLKSAGLVGARDRVPSEPAVLFLASKGLTLLHQHGTLSQYPSLSLPALEKRARVSDLTISHELKVMDVKAAFHGAVKKTESFSIAEFSTWPLLHQFETYRSGYGGAEITVKPDGFIRIHENEADGGLSEHTFFLEIDCSTEAHEILISKADCYLNHYKSGGFAERNGAPRSAYKDYPFRVLIVCNTAERRNNIAACLVYNQRPIFTQVWLSTLAEVKANLFAPIWIRPTDYHQAVLGSVFEGQVPSSRRHRRQIARDILIEQKAAKHMLLN